MKLVIQVVKNASLSVDDKIISKIDKGLVVFFGVGKEDDGSVLDFLAKKVANMRIFDDENGKMNYSVKDVKGQILLVSQFTLYGDVSHGNRPSFFDAKAPQDAEKIYLEFAKALEKHEIDVKLGVFGENMQIKQQNDGPVTILLEA